MPLELNPLVSKMSPPFNPNNMRQLDDGRRFYFGRLAGTDVVLAMTGIGTVNATQTTEDAVNQLGCTFSAIMFSGVAGSRYNIGDVTIPKQWTLFGSPFIQADPGMLAAAAKLHTDGPNKNVSLSRDVPVGDAACLCPGVDAATPVHMPQAMQLYVGGNGETSDTFAGHAIPCVPGGGDIEGCEPCFQPGHAPEDAARFASRAPGLITDTKFWQALLQQDQTTQTFDAQDEETAAVAKVATEATPPVPFLGVRAASDGNNDPLHLPGFPFQFAVYRQLAANNAAAVTIAFLNVWRGPN